MSITAVGFWTAKRGNAEREWEDGFALDETRLRFAVSDGASTSAKAAQWAATLTDGFLSDSFDAHDELVLEQWIARRCGEFAERFVEVLDDEVDTGNWLQHAASTKHGFATFVGAEFRELGGSDVTCRWVGVGDACIFHTRDGRLLAAGPTSDGGGFGLHPDLISSNPEHGRQAVDAAFRGEVSVRPGDTVLLVTDALAEWALKTAPSDDGVWRVLNQLDTTGFERLVSDLRSSELMVNDDVTLVRCEVAR